MIGPSDRIALAPGVRLDCVGLHDPVRDATFPLNESGRVVVCAGTIADASAVLVRSFAVSPERALADATSFCAELNERLLLDVAPHGGSLRLAIRWLALACRLLPLRVLPHVPARRRHVETAALPAMLRTGSRALFGPALVFAVLAGLATLVVARLPLIAFAVAFAVGAGVLVHELGHLALLRGVPACVVVRGLSVSVLHRRLDPHRESRVALGGPGAGIALTAAALLALNLYPSTELATVVLIEAVQLLGLTTLTHDGRRACARW